MPPTEHTHRVTLDDERLSKLGTCSLLGLLLTETMGLPDRLVLAFPASTLVERRRNGGPRELIITEFNVPCLLNDVLTLIKQGVKVEVEYDG